MPENEANNVVTQPPPSIQISELPSKPFRITVEIPMLLVMMGLTLSSAAIGNIILYRTCVHTLGHSVDECKEFLNPHKNNQSSSLEREVQKYTTYVMSVKMILESLGPAVLSFFMGAWSDTHGRKPLVVWPIFGMALSMMMIVVYALMDNLGPWWYVLTAAPFSLTGGYVVLFTGAFCYISDVTSTDKRSLRMVLLEATVAMGSAFGGMLSSYLLKAVGNVYLLLIVTTLFVIAYAYTNVYVRESLNGAVRGGITTVLDFLLVKEMFRECFKRRPNRGRAQIVLLTMCNCLVIFILYGLSSLEYLYSREKIHWSMKDYTIFSSTSTVISFVGGILGVIVFQRLLGVGDLMFANVAFVSATVDFVIKAWATKTWHMYLGASVSLFRGISTPLIRSFLTKMLPVEDIAKVFSLICALEGICPLFSPAIYSSLYYFTIATFPGAIYVLSASISVVCIVFLGCVQYFRYKAISVSYAPMETETLTSTTWTQ